MAELRRATSGGATIVVVDGLDALAGADRDQAAAVLRDAASDLDERHAGAGALTVVAIVRRELGVLDILAEAHRPAPHTLPLHGGASATSASEPSHPNTEVIPS